MTTHRLQRVDRALAKFTSGAYGFCESCGQPIDFARLKALPDARFCLKCQRQREIPGGPTTGPAPWNRGSSTPVTPRTTDLSQHTLSWLIALTTAVVVIVLDRVSKLWVINDLDLYEGWAPIHALAPYFQIFIPPTPALHSACCGAAACCLLSLPPLPSSSFWSSPTIGPYLSPRPNQPGLDIGRRRWQPLGSPRLRRSCHRLSRLPHQRTPALSYVQCG